MRVKCIEVKAGYDMFKLTAELCAQICNQGRVGGLRVQVRCKG